MWDQVFVLSVVIMANYGSELPRPPPVLSIRTSIAGTLSRTSAPCYGNEGTLTVAVAVDAPAEFVSVYDTTHTPPGVEIVPERTPFAGFNVTPAHSPDELDPVIVAG